MASLAGKERAAADEVRGECRGVPRAPQRQTQLLLLPNSRKVHTEAPKEDVLINGNLRLDSFLEGHDHPHVAVRRHFLRKSPDTSTKYRRRELLVRPAVFPTLLGHALNLLAGAALRYRERLGLGPPAVGVGHLLRPVQVAGPASRPR